MQIYNSMTRKKEPFVPLHEGKVGIYACGPTVYNFFHIGNARPFIVFDVLRRYLEYRGYEVTFVQNFTDIDDKMIRRANEEGVTVAEIAERYIAEYFTDAKALGIRPATVHPRATEHIRRSSRSSAAHRQGTGLRIQGDVYYRVRAFPSYGCLWRAESGGPGKRRARERGRGQGGPAGLCPLEGAEARRARLGKPLGHGPPRLAHRVLGHEHHLPGRDVRHPRRAARICSSRTMKTRSPRPPARPASPTVRYWMHNGFINIDNEKMSKSKGNFFTVRDISKEFDLEAVRLFMLSAHYRSPINFSRDLIEAAASSLERLYNARDQLQFLLTSAQDRTPDEGERAFMDECLRSEEKFIAAMDDDLNTAPRAGRAV